MYSIGILYIFRLKITRVHLQRCALARFASSGGVCSLVDSLLSFLVRLFARQSIHNDMTITIKYNHTKPTFGFAFGV